MKRHYLGIDIGGTFTDLVLATQDGAAVSTLKILTTPVDPVLGVINGVRELLVRSGVPGASVGRVVHATTLATNLILEGRGDKVAYVTTEGFGGVPLIGRDTRAGESRYDLYFEKPLPPVHPVFEVPERMSARGDVLKPLDHAAVAAIGEQLAARPPLAVAICLLNSYANAAHELAIAKILRARIPGLHVAASVDIWPQYREFDRGMTTIMSAYVGPILARYLGRLEAELGSIGISVPLQFMKSNGGIVLASDAIDRAVYAVESGPAAGIVAAGYIGRLCDERNVIAFDMGGTTAKAGLVRDGEPTMTQEFYVGGSASVGSHRSGGFPIQIPVIDLAEVGSGGGSIAWVDDGGVLNVGPKSAGAEPGPACYDRGGTAPTVTDADLVLGYLDPDYFVGGAMRISRERAMEAIAAVASRLSLDPLAVAVGIHNIANANMSAAVRGVTVERGIDPREFTAVASGGAGPVHIARVAAEFKIPRIVIPRLAGVVSAMGLIASNIMMDHVRSHIEDTATADPALLTEIFLDLERQTWLELEPYGLRTRDVRVMRSIELRYRHQAHAFAVPFDEAVVTRESLDRLTASFSAFYNARFGISSNDPTEIVNLRMRVIGEVPKIEFVPRPTRPGDGSAALLGNRPAYFSEFDGYVETPVYGRQALQPGDALRGPAIIQEPDSTIVVPPEHRLNVDAFLNLVIQPIAADAAETVSVGEMAEL